MALIEVNTSEERYTGVVEAGDYILECEEAKLIDVKSDPEKKQMIFRFSYNYEDKVAEAVRFTPLGGKGVTFTREVLTALGVAFKEVGHTLSFDADDCDGKKCMATNSPGQREGKDQNNWGSFVSVA